MAPHKPALLPRPPSSSCDRDRPGTESKSESPRACPSVGEMSQTVSCSVDRIVVVLKSAESDLEREARAREPVSQYVSYVSPPRRMR